jgi:hypothetical protein
MATDAHMTQVLPDPDYRPKKYDLPTKMDLPYIFCFIKLSPSHTVEAVDARQIPFRVLLTRGVGVWGPIPAMSLSPIEEYPHAKFH